MIFAFSGLLAVLPLAAQTTNPAPAVSTPANTADSSNSAAAPFDPASIERVVVAAPVTNTPAATASAVTAPITPTLQPDPFGDPLIVQIVARYQKAWDGDKKETKALTADLERWTKDEPTNYLLLAYLGSAYALDSRDAWIGPGKLSFLKKGDAALDAAVAGDPSNPAIRLLRAMNYYELPAMFGKHKAANDDFHILIAQLQGQRPMIYTLKTDTAQAIYYYAGLSDVQFDQQPLAKDAWQRGMALAPQSKLGQKMQIELKKLR